MRLVQAENGGVTWTWASVGQADPDVPKGSAMIPEPDAVVVAVQSLSERAMVSPGSVLEVTVNFRVKQKEGT